MVARKRTPSLIREESGQSLVVLVLGMVVILGIAAFAIDVGSWLATRHKAQVTADAMALAAANYMANNPSAAATSGQSFGQGTKYTQGSGLSPSGATVVVDTSAGTATATVTTAGTVSFARAVGIGPPTISATAVATYKQGDSPYSLFADGTCTPGNPASITINVGGDATVSGVHSNGGITGQIGNNTKINTLSNGSGCANTLCAGSGNCNNNPVAPVLTSPNNLNWPVPYDSPSCELSSNGPACYFDTTTADLSTTCTYVAGTGTPPTNVSSSGGNITITGNVGSSGSPVVLCAPSGTITVAGNSVTVHGTLYAQNVIFSGNSPTIIPPADDLGIYVSGSGTLDLDPGNGGGNGSNNVALVGAFVYAPNGSVNLGGNNGSGLIEAQSITVSGNNWTFTGTGPTDPYVYGDHLVQ
jgi:Flp pilus assembly protein TadG